MKVSTAALIAVMSITSTHASLPLFSSQLSATPLRTTTGWIAASSIRGGSTAASGDDEEKAAKKKKKKSSKKVVAKKSASPKKEETEKPEDFSQAILKGSAGRNSMQVFTYSEDEGHTVVGMTESAMETMELFDGDTISIKGKRGKKTFATVASVSDTDAGALSDNDGAGVGMSKDTMKNCGVRAGDAVTIVPAPNVKFGKAILVLPYADSLASAGIESTEDANVFEDYLKPYFEGKFRTLHRGDSFHIDGPMGDLEFQVIEIDSVENDGDTACVVVDDTIIESDGDAIDRDDMDDLEGAGYDTIGGASKHLAAIRELVELPLRHPELWRKLGINPPRGVLLTGPSGCGKTAMARAVAAETGAYFFVINGPEVISKRAGESETNLRRAFEDAAENAEDYNGAIIFIDELDSIAPKREKAGGEVEKRIVSQLLTLMDGMKPTSKVVVMAATNRPSTIEPALRRPGRFDRELDMAYPTNRDDWRFFKSRLVICALVRMLIWMSSQGVVMGMLAQIFSSFVWKLLSSVSAAKWASSTSTRTQ